MLDTQRGCSRAARVVGSVPIPPVVPWGEAPHWQFSRTFLPDRPNLPVILQLQMKRPAALITLSTLALAPLASAQDGKVMYEQLCGACHGNDGQGAQEGQFPPLADSAWIKGAPDRMIQVVLHGMMGEVTVPSKFAASPTYNLVMPPQGAALTSDQISKITTYVRTSWGNKEGVITVAMVEAQRKVEIPVPATLPTLGQLRMHSKMPTTRILMQRPRRF